MHCNHDTTIGRRSPIRGVAGSRTLETQAAHVRPQRAPTRCLCQDILYRVCQDIPLQVSPDPPARPELWSGGCGKSISRMYICR